MLKERTKLNQIQGLQIGDDMNKSKIQNTKSKIFSGFSLIEMLVVIFVFSILGIVATQIIAMSLRGSQKSESIGEVRANVEYTVSTMERLLRNATEINVTGCNTSTIRLDYKDEYKKDCHFECVTSGFDRYIASGSAGVTAVRLTSNKVRIQCSNIFSCNQPLDVPPTVSITLVGEDAELGTGVGGSRVTVKTQLQLRTY